MRGHLPADPAAALANASGEVRRLARKRRGVAAFALFSLACAAGDERGPASIVRDSAGVVIVENARAAWEEGAGWSIDPEPLVRIGVVEGEPAYQLFRAWSAVRLSDGRIVIANGGTSELRFYDPQGRHLLSAGREGEGPGEFRDLQRVWLLPGDSLLAYDFFPAKLSVFTPAGEFVRSVHVRAPDGRQVLVQGALDDGTLIAQGAPIWVAPGATSSIVRDSVPYYRFDRDGRLLDTLGWFPSTEAYRIVTGDDWMMTGLPFPRAPVRTVARDRFIFGPADAYELQVYTPEGRIERLIRLPYIVRRVTPEDIAAFRARRLQQAEREGTRARMERILAELPYPETMPPYRALLVDANGNLWVADYRSSDDEPTSWRVFAAHGEYLGVVTLPPRLELLQIGRDFALVRAIDELEVETIQVHRLVRRAG